MGDVESSVVGGVEESSASDSSLSDHLVRKGTVIERKTKNKESVVGDKGNNTFDIKAEHRELATALQELSESLKGLKIGQEQAGIGGEEKDDQAAGAVDVRTIPFRSASFSQVDVTSDGQHYVRNLKSPQISLKPSAFCLTSSFNTFPRSSNKVIFQLGDLNYGTLAPIPQWKGEDMATSEEISKPSQSSNKESSKEEARPEVFQKNAQTEIKKQEEQEGSSLSPQNSCESPPKESESTKPFWGEKEKGPQRSSSSEEGAESPTSPLTSSEKAKMAFKLGLLTTKLPLLDLDSGVGGGGGSSVSGSGGEEDDKSSNLIRQSSGQSDGSEGQSSDPNTTATTSPTTNRVSSLNVETKPLSTFRSSGSISSPPPGFSGHYKYNYRTPGSPPAELPLRTSSVSSGSSYSTNSVPRRYYRPLRGPYGEMLEAEMNKVWSERKSRELDTLDFAQSKSKSSSPPPNSEGGVSLGASPKLGNSLLMASMDDININSKLPKHQNPRCRKISTNIPVSSSTSYHSGGESSVLAYHQRTASSPSQLLHTPSVEKQASPSPRRNLDASPRGHVLAELVETEKSYVDSLRILVKKYMEPLLKSSDFIDAGLVDDIFFQIPVILRHHERLLEALQRRVIDDTQSVGDVLLDTFRQNSLLECYSLFVNNWKNAKGSLKMAVASKPPLARFLESNARQHKGKLSIDSLLIMPIQRIPRYELLVKELLKHTEPTHEDHSRLILVLEKIKKFAVHIDCASVDPNDNREIEIEGWSAGLGHLLRQDIVTITTASNVRKERALFLFADSVVVASIKRKTTMRKTSSNQYQPSGPNLEGCKFKLLMKVGLSDVHLLNDDVDGCPKGASPEDLEDLRTIHKMMDLASLLRCPHVILDDVLKDLASGLRHPCDNNADALELEIKAADGSGENSEILKIQFGSGEKRNSWTNCFQDTIDKFVRYGFGKLPQMSFLQALPIRKTRAGLQLSCAAPVSLIGNGQRLESSVWVANSDGYVGQICILTLQSEPAITSCNGVCNSRITCILAVPPTPMSPTSQDYDGEEDYHRGNKASMEHWSVWLGTEDGALHIYDCSDSVRVKKNKHKIQHKAPLNTMAYYDCRVLVSMGNGDVAMYTRNLHGKHWLVNEPTWITIGSGMNPVTKMLCVGSSIWCASGSQIKVYSSDSNNMLELLQTVTVNGDHAHRSVSTLAASDEVVWVAVHSSSIIKCYNNSSCETLFQVDVASEVSKILAGCDDIIRQHKSACLRITALVVAPDKTLWIGTSAGVVLTLAASGPGRKLTPLCQGHTGQVRFLTCSPSRDSAVIISGGDGYEEFRPGFPSSSSSSSSAVSATNADNSGDLSGREDSTNHLLIWRVPKIGSSS